MNKLIIFVFSILILSQIFAGIDYSDIFILGSENENNNRFILLGNGNTNIGGLKYDPIRKNLYWTNDNNTFNLMGGGGSGITDHALLSNLGFINSNHTGFQAALGFTPEFQLSFINPLSRNGNNIEMTEADPVYSASNANHITSSDMLNWNSKQDALAYTPENIDNKNTDVALGNSNKFFPTQNATKSYIDTALTGKENTLTKYNLTGTTNQISLSGSGTSVLLARDITLSTPQDIGLNSNVTFYNIFARNLFDNMPTNPVPNGSFAIDNSNWVGNTNLIVVKTKTSFDIANHGVFIKEDGVNATGQYFTNTFVLPEKYRGKNLEFYCDTKGNNNYLASYYYISLRDLDAGTQETLTYPSVAAQTYLGQFNALASSENYQIRIGVNTTNQNGFDLYVNNCQIGPGDKGATNFSATTGSFSNLIDSGPGGGQRVLLARSDNYIIGDADLVFTGTQLNVNGSSWIGSTTNNTYFDTDGTMLMNGNATVWNDIVIRASNLGTGGTVPAYSAFVGNIYTPVFEDAKSQDVSASWEVPHGFRNTNMEVHIHWSPSSTNTGNANVQFEYNCSNVGSAFAASNTTLLALAKGSGTVRQHQYTALGNINAVPLTTGAVCDFSFKRDGTDGQDDGTFNLILHDIGIHYQQYKLGTDNVNN